MGGGRAHELRWHRDRHAIQVEQVSDLFDLMWASTLDAAIPFSTRAGHCTDDPYLQHMLKVHNVNVSTYARPRDLRDLFR